MTYNYCIRVKIWQLVIQSICYICFNVYILYVYILSHVYIEIHANTLILNNIIHDKTPEILIYIKKKEEPNILHINFVQWVSHRAIAKASLKCKTRH